MAKPAGLTVKQLEALAPRAQTYEVKDDAEPGLYVCVLPSGRRSFVWRYRFHNKSKKLTIGPVSLAEARRKAREARNLRDDGTDPAEQKRSAKASLLETARQAENAALLVAPDDIQTIVAAFINRHHKPANRSWREAARLLEKEIVMPWRGRRLSEITRADIHAWLDAIIDRPAPVLANRMLAHLHTLCRWAAARGVIASNPCDGLNRPTREKPRSRVLEDSELGLIWKAAERGGWPFAPLIKLLILTGQRLNEIAEGHWSEIDLDAKVWSLSPERVKNKRMHSVALTLQAIKIIEHLPRIGDSDLMFSTTGTTAISGFSRAKRNLDAAVAELNGGESIAPWTLHDIRRSVASGFQRLGVPLHVVEKVLNHVSGSFGGIVGVYQQHEYAAEKRQALERWAAHIERIVVAETTAKIIPLRASE